jgi:hypothetical protein
VTLDELAERLRAAAGVRHKLDIQQARANLPPTSVPVGDDCAAIPDSDGYALLAIEGLVDSFVEAEPWFAGYCAVMVNLSDIAAMGGRATAVVDAIWTRDATRAGPVWNGMMAASRQYGVPIVGGHTNARAPGDHLAVAVLGRARNLISSFDARPGDVLIHATDLRGEWFGDYPYWNASTTAPADRLRGDMSVLPELAEAGLCRAGKDVSMSGIVGTATMLAEASGVGFTLDVTIVPTPPGVAAEKWLTAFPSYGYLLAAKPEDATAVCNRFTSRGIDAAVVGTFNDTRRCVLSEPGGGRALFWDLARESFTGFGPA